MDAIRIRQAELCPPAPARTLITSHGLALLYVATHPDATTREISDALEITERRVVDLIRELRAANLVVVTRRGRRNSYAINANARFRHPLIADIPFKAFIGLWEKASTSADEQQLSAGPAQ